MSALLEIIVKQCRKKSNKVQSSHVHDSDSIKYYKKMFFLCKQGLKQKIKA